MKTDRKPDPTAALLLMGRVLLGVLFIYASWDKILDPAAFAVNVANYQILPPLLVNPVALALPWLELVCGVCLIINRWVQGSALVTALLVVVFMMALGYSAFKGIDISCGCFTMTGDAPESVWGYLVRDAIILTVAITILLHPKARSPISALFNSNSNGDVNRHAI